MVSKMLPHQRNEKVDWFLSGSSTLERLVLVAVILSKIPLPTKSTFEINVLDITMISVCASHIHHLYNEQLLIGEYMVYI